LIIPSTSRSNRRKRELIVGAHARATLVCRRAQVVRRGSTVVKVVASASSATHHLGVVLHHGEKHSVVHDHVELSGTHRRQLTQHDVLRYTTAVVKLTKTGSFQKNFNRLLERTTHKCASVIAVDAVTGDGHEKTALAHDVDKQCHVAMVDV